jgi:Ca2+/Na+ antiporter
MLLLVVVVVVVVVMMMMMMMMMMLLLLLLLLLLLGYNRKERHDTRQLEFSLEGATGHNQGNASKNRINNPHHA